MRKTPLLTAVIEILKDQSKPLSVPEILSALRDKNLTPNKTTLYRMLDKLVEQKKVEALLLDPKITYYEIKTHHHQHFVCKSCEKIQCVHDSDLVLEIKKLSTRLADKGLMVQGHNFSMQGTCDDCQ